MKLLADESVDGPIVERLRRDGHDVLYVAEIAPGIDNEGILNMARRERAVLLTADRDFGELVVRLRMASWGVVLLRLAGLKADRKAEIASGVIARYGSRLHDLFMVVEPSAVRTRNLIQSA
jgi:predicted nuclease of predicted toxin-antitoxin system